MTDGPLAETKEPMEGDSDIEIRPVFEMDDFERRVLDEAKKR